jgi:hypothetical protein
LSDCFSDATNSSAKSSASTLDKKGKGRRDDDLLVKVSESIDDLSGVVKEESKEEIKKWKNWKESGYGEISRAATLIHKYSGTLRSAYSSIDGIAIEDSNIFVPIEKSEKGPVPALPFTNYTSGFNGVIDYIFYSDEALEVYAVLGGYLLEPEVGGRDIVEWMISRENGKSQNLKTRSNDSGNGWGLTISPPASIISASPKNSDTKTKRSFSLPHQLSSSHELFTHSLFIPPVQSHALGNSGREGEKSVWSVQGSGSVGFPNAVFPSDHIPIVAVFRWKSNRLQQNHG